MEKLTQRHNRRKHARTFDLSQDDFDNKIRASTQFVRIQKYQLIDLQESLERYCNVLPVFGLKTAKYDPKLFKSYFLPILVNGHVQPADIKKRRTSFGST